MLNLSQKIRQRELSYSRFTEPLDNQDSNGQPVIVTKSGDNPPTEFIPRSARIKNPVFCSNDVKEDGRVVKVMQRCKLRHETYKAEQAKDIKVLSGIKIKIRQESLQDNFLKAAFNTPSRSSFKRRMKIKQRKNATSPPTAP